MATNRKRTPRSRRDSNVTPEQYGWLFDSTEGQGREIWVLLAGGAEKKALWEANREEVLAGWVEDNPCTRPRRWWEYDAPPELVAGCESADLFAMQAHRQRLGGIGTPSHECLRVVPRFCLGIPQSWVTPWDESYYNGSIVSGPNAGQPTGHAEGSFTGKAINPLDPPRFESQAAYLQRHSLLTADEVKYLKRHPELLEPETVTLK